MNKTRVVLSGYCADLSVIEMLLGFLMEKPIEKQSCSDQKVQFSRIRKNDKLGIYEYEIHAILCKDTLIGSSRSGDNTERS